MIETTLAFFALYMFTWPTLLGFVVFAVWTEYVDSRAWTIFSALIISFIAYNLYTIPFDTLLYGALAYLTFGIIWSFWRYKRYVATELAKFKKIEQPSDVIKHRFVRDIDFTQMVDTIVAWIIVWPFSLVEMALSDLIEALDTLVRTVFKRVYTAIYNSALKDANIDLTDLQK